MTAAQREDYQRTGELPTEIKPTFDGDSSPPVQAAPAAEIAATDPPPASEPAKPAKGAEARKAELQAEIDGLLKQRAELRKQPPPVQTPPAASSPAPVDLGPKPDGTDYTKYPLGTSDPQYVEDLAGWKARELFASERKATAEATAKATATADATRIAQDWQRRVETVKSKHPDVIEKFSEPIAIPQGSAADLWVLESDMGPETLYHLYAHPEEVARITALSPLKQIEAMVVLGLSLTDAAPPVKTKTEAPAPAPTLDTRPAAAANDADAAMARGDFAAYTRIKNEQEMAGLRGRK
jgi:hypothetical protein